MIRTTFLMIALSVAAPVLAEDDAPTKPAVQTCLNTRSIQQAQPGADKHWYARLRDGSWWRNRMDCPALGLGRALVHSSPIGSQCRGDIVQVVDFTLGGVNFGGCGMGDWERVDGPPAKTAPKK